MKRRRFLAVTAAAGACLASPARAFRLDPVEWRGVAMGAAAHLTIHHEDRTEALRLLKNCVAEIDRLERIFSLYRPDSTLVRLNNDKRLEAPPFDLLSLLNAVERVWHVSGGAFDPTVQPLWDAYARHFQGPGADPGGPPPALLERLRPAIGWKKVVVSAEAVELLAPGMALTLNEVAQGYVTDRITEILARGGMKRVLVHLGETRTIGQHGDGRPWRVGLSGSRTVELHGMAVAVSSADGTRFSPLCHHLFDPAAVKSAKAATDMAVMAPTATLADALSTACAVAPEWSADILARGGGTLL